MANNITIYRGTIRKLYADNITLNKNTIAKDVKRTIINDDASFYYNFGVYVNMEYGCLLANEEEAEIYMNSVLKNKEYIIREILTNESISDEEKQKFKEALKKTSSCIYYSKSDIKPKCEVSKKEFKELKKTLKTKRR